MSKRSMKSMETIKPKFPRSEVSREMYEVLRLIATEFICDPMSVQCFDLRVVERAKHIVKLYEQEEPKR